MLFSFCHLQATLLALFSNSVIALGASYLGSPLECHFGYFGLSGIWIFALCAMSISTGVVGQLSQRLVSTYEHRSCLITRCPFNDPLWPGRLCFTISICFHILVIPNASPFSGNHPFITLTGPTWCSSLQLFFPLAHPVSCASSPP